MSDVNGVLRLEYNNNSLSFGTVERISHNLSKSCMITALVSLRAESAFGLDTKTGKTITLSFSRVNPISPNDDSSDSTRWSNAFWKGELIKAVNRWQCRTDGARLSFIPSSDNPYMPPIDDVNGYIKTLSFSYTSSNNTMISGSMEFHVGTMYVKTRKVSESEGVPQDGFQIQLSDSSAQNYYLIQGKDVSGNEVNCVSSYTLCGGLESPFEYVTLKIPKDRLSYIVPQLMTTDADGNKSIDIIAGRNKLIISAVGRSNMTVTKCKLQSGTYTITAYCDAEILKGYAIPVAGEDTPERWIQTILSSGNYGVSFSGNTLKTNYKPSDCGTVAFRAGQNTWYILQVCAMLLGCRVFFSNNCAYVIDYRDAEQSTNIDDQGVIDLYPTSTGGQYYSTVTGTVSLGDEGTDTIVNMLTVRYTQVTPSTTEGEPDGTEVVESDPPFSDQESINVFGRRSGDLLYLTELRKVPDTTKMEEVTDPETGEVTEVETTVPGYDQAKIFAENYIDYRSEPQQSIEFKLKEMYETTSGDYVWVPTFDPCSRATDIIDTVDDTRITNTSDIPGRDDIPQKLCLSSYEHNYPEGTTTYTWGVMANIDLSSSTSQIVSSLNNV